MAFEHLLLGIILECPSHGYKIKKTVAPFVTRERVLNDALLYPKLRKLQEKGMLSKEVVPQEGLPGRNQFSVTEQGSKEFLEWLRSARDEEDFITYDFFLKYDFLAKCMFFKHLSPEERREKLGQQIRMTEDKILEFRDILEGMQKRQADDYRVRIMSFGLKYQQMKLSWLTEILQEEQRGSPSLKKGEEAKKKARSRSRREATDEPDRGIVDAFPPEQHFRGRHRRSRTA